MAKLKIRKDRTPAVLRKLAKDETDGRVARRLLTIANALLARAQSGRARLALFEGALPVDAAGYDAVDASGRRYQIKARRIGTSRSTRQLSAIRNLDQDPFEVLTGILFDQDFTVHRAALIPIVVVKQRSTWSKHTNSRIFYLLDDIWTDPGVVDVSAEPRAVAAEL